MVTLWSHRAALNFTPTLGVKSVMKLAGVLLVMGAAFLAASIPHSKREMRGTPKPVQPHADFREIHRAAGNMASIVNDLQAAYSRDGSGAGWSAGNLWIEVNRLKREGRNVRAIEWYVCDLEGSLRSGPQDAIARRHILNNLSYEVEVLKQRQR